MPHDGETPRQKYTGGLIVSQTHKIHTDNSPMPPLNFTVGQKVRNLAMIFIA